MDVNNSDELQKIGLCRFSTDDYDFLFDEDGNIFGLRGVSVGNHHAELEQYFQEHGYGDEDPKKTEASH